MEIIQIIGIGFSGVIIAVLLKEYRPEYKMYISIVVGILIFFLVSQNIASFINQIMNLSKRLNIKNEFVSILLKITGIAILKSNGFNSNFDLQR